VVFEFYELWAPLGFDRVVSLFETQYFDQQYVYRVVPSFLVQFGVTDDVTKKLRWSTPIIDDPPNKEHQFERGTVSFAGSGPNSRTADLFISYSKNTNLGKAPWEVPIGRVIDGMEHIDSFESRYGDISAFNPNGPDPQELGARGTEYVRSSFPLLDQFLKCKFQAESKENALASPIKVGSSNVLTHTNLRFQFKYSNISASAEETRGHGLTVFFSCIIYFLAICFVYRKVYFKFCTKTRAKRRQN
jgi:cyclophilin family peptidyl-prolyl cis-trans isomerase